MPEQKKKQKILIADDSEMNRELLVEMLQDQYELLEAENGRRAVELLTEKPGEISLVLLDLLMPEMDGFEVLAEMNRRHWIEETPVIVISAETAPAYIDRAYEFGVTDFITRPFNMAVVHHRVENALLLFAKQKKMTGIIADQLYKNKQNSRLMISVLSHIVEFRNGESGSHVTHINVITSLLLQQLRQREKKYGVSAEAADLIATASSLHDIGKIAIPAEILNKPGKLTDEEFAVMRTHSLLGAEMLRSLPENQWGTPLVQLAYEICRWHHERYDGSGYPDGLKGDGIPISAQVVSLADVYDALTSQRCYKKAFSHETALDMIFSGQCGAFNPALLDCLRDIAPELPEELLANSDLQNEQEDAHRVAEEMHSYGLISSEHALETNFPERQKEGSPLLPHDAATRLEKLEKAIRQVSNGSLNVTLEPERDDEIGKLVTAFQSMATNLHKNLKELNDRAYRDGLTLVKNRAAYQRDIDKLDQQIRAGSDCRFAVAVMDVNYLKYINNTYGHAVGDELIVQGCKTVCHVFDHSPVYRIGGDEFAVIMKDDDYLHRKELTEKLRKSAVEVDCQDGTVFRMPMSLGLSDYDPEADRCFRDVFNRADALMYQNKMNIKSAYPPPVPAGKNPPQADTNP